ncbi:MAG: biotin--[acetyl-CoA-carboxylase] ligase [Mariniblastus sp.]|nr:biotin--[acetyl-CoA-carboxylase] ligase [Mariniblastus sp.]
MPDSKPFDSERLLKSGRIKSVEFRQTTPSTNDWAKQLIEQQADPSEGTDLSASCPKLLLAAIQTAGRGQQQRSWWSGRGSLTFSLVDVLPDSILPLTTGLATALSLAETLNELAPQLEPRIKWPNDLYLNRRKVAGILVESVRCHDRAFQVIGVGVNVNNVLTDLPDEVRTMATSLAECTGQSYDLTRFLIRWSNHYFAAQQLRLANPTELVSRCQARSQLEPGQAVTLELPDGRQVEGTFAGLSERGGLLLQQDGPAEEFLSARLKPRADPNPPVS